MTDTLDAFWMMDGRIEILVAQDENEDRLSVLRHTVPRGEAPPLHVHHDEDEIFQILSGRLRFQQAARVFEAGAGATVFLQRGIAHGFRVLSPEGAVFLTITRGPFEQMVRAAGRPATQPGLPTPTVLTPELQAHFAQICAAHRIDFVGPPIA